VEGDHDAIVAIFFLSLPLISNVCATFKELIPKTNDWSTIKTYKATDFALD
jgi:hypothetical protein